MYTVYVYMQADQADALAQPERLAPKWYIDMLFFVKVLEPKVHQLYMGTTYTWAQQFFMLGLCCMLGPAAVFSSSIMCHPAW